MIQGVCREVTSIVKTELEILTNFQTATQPTSQTWPRRTSSCSINSTIKSCKARFLESSRRRRGGQGSKKTTISGRIKTIAMRGTFLASSLSMIMLRSASTHMIRSDFYQAEATAQSHWTAACLIACRVTKGAACNPTNPTTPVRIFLSTRSTELHFSAPSTTWMFKMSSKLRLSAPHRRKGSQESARIRRPTWRGRSSSSYKRIWKM